MSREERERRKEGVVVGGYWLQMSEISSQLPFSGYMTDHGKAICMWRPQCSYLQSGSKYHTGKLWCESTSYHLSVVIIPGYPLAAGGALLLFSWLLTVSITAAYKNSGLDRSFNHHRISLNFLWPPSFTSFFLIMCSQDSIPKIPAELSIALRSHPPMRAINKDLLTSATCQTPCWAPKIWCWANTGQFLSP